MIRKKINCCLLLGFITVAGHCQEVQFSGWLFNFTNIRFHQKWSLHWDAQLRSTDQLKSVGAILLRPGLNYHLNPHIILTAGYAFVDARKTIGEISNLLPEHRIWQQFLGTHRLYTSAIGHRVRLEERSVPVAGVSDSRLVVADRFWSMRFRYFVRGLLPLRKVKTFSKGAFVALQDEVFINLTSLDKLNGKYFDQNRFYIALGYRFSDLFDLELGYMNQYTSGREESFINNHILQLATYIRIQT